VAIFDRVGLEQWHEHRADETRPGPDVELVNCIIERTEETYGFDVERDLLVRVRNQDFDSRNNVSFEWTGVVGMVGAVVCVSGRGW